MTLWYVTAFGIGRTREEAMGIAQREIKKMRRRFFWRTILEATSITVAIVVVGLLIVWGIMNWAF